MSSNTHRAHYVTLLAAAAALCVAGVASVSSGDLISQPSGPLWLAGGQLEDADQQQGGGPEAQHNPMSSELEQVLRRVGPNMRASADYRDYQDQSLNGSLEAWRLLHERARAHAQAQVAVLAPRVRQLLADANASSACASSSERMMAAAGQLEAWALQMWTFSGSFPPGGLLDGQFTDLGHYRGCVDISRALASQNESTRAAATTREHPASYCLVGFRPIVPARKRFHLIFEEESRQLTGLFNASDFLAELAHKAQYFHYVYMKTGVCVPSECTVDDLQRVAVLVARRLALMAAPVKCFTRAVKQHAQPDGTADKAVLENLENLENNKPVLVNLNRGLNQTQLVALTIICTFFSLVFAVTLWHAAELAWREACAKSKWASVDDDDFELSQDGHPLNGVATTTNNNSNSNKASLSIKMDMNIQQQQQQQEPSSIKATAFHYFSMITNGREFLDASMRPSEIRCLHGFRVFTMVWIICVHTLQYNEWSGFTRIFENVPSFQSLAVHPLINANYVVDNFFLMSGLLAAYTTWHSNKGAASNFSIVQSLLGRYLRLTPQVLLISLMYIVLPQMGPNGPFWYDMTHYSGKYCEKNWWVNLLHIQSFYRKDEICNLVGWWISVDMFYYALGLVLLWLILNKRLQLALLATSLYVAYCTAWTAWRHYTGGFSPNNLGLAPQVQEVWREFVVEFFWSPGPHAFVFFLGFWLGYVLANKLGLRFVRRWSRPGWLLSLTTFLVVNMSSRLWTTGVLELKPEHQYISTGYNILCVIGWSCSFAWMILACQYGCAPVLDRFLSTRISIMLSKASFIIYLSHMLILRTFFGSQYNLLEVSIGTITLLMLGLIIVSILFGVFLCVAFEGPCLKFQKLIMRSIKTERKLPLAGSSYHIEMNKSSNGSGGGGSDEKGVINLNPTNVALLKQ